MLFWDGLFSGVCEFQGGYIDTCDLLMIHFKHGTIFQAIKIVHPIIHPILTVSLLSMLKTWVDLCTWMSTIGTAFDQGMWANGKTTACMVGEGAYTFRLHLAMFFLLKSFFC